MVVNPDLPRDKGGIVSMAQPAIRRESAARCSAL
jgi:hypothetical protein